MALSPERQTLLTHGGRRGHGDPGRGGGLAGGDLAGAGQEDLTHDHVVDLVRAGPRPLQGGAYGDRCRARRRRSWRRPPDSLPMGVRAPATMTEPGMGFLLCSLASSLRAGGTLSEWR